MSEGLSPEESSQAKLHRERYTGDQKLEEHLYKQLDSTDDVRRRIREVPGRFTEEERVVVLKVLDTLDGEHRRVLDEVKRDVDAGLWRAQQQKNEHLDQFIETARQEAEADGVEIKLPDQDQTDQA